MPDNEAGRPDIHGDAQRLWGIMKAGGVAIVPADQGYGIWAGSVEGVHRINAAKQRGPHKRQGVLMTDATARELHVLNQRQRDMIECVTLDYGLPLGVIAEFREEHWLIQALTPELRRLCTARGTVANVYNTGGVFNEAIARRSEENRWPIFGSSANVSGAGMRYRIQDIEPQIIAAADGVFDYGLRPLHLYKVASTQIDFARMQVVRWGTYFEPIADILKRHFNWELPADPGRDASPNGHADEFALASLKD